MSNSPNVAGAGSRRTPQLIVHRVNAIRDLVSVPRENGVEIDLRSRVDVAGALHLSHDPWHRGDDFVEWLREFKRLAITGPIILNTKEDGLEDRVLAAMDEVGVTQFFFLDTALPTLVKWVRKGLGRRFAVRLSAFEPEEALVPFQGHVQWVWVDCFDGEPLAVEQVRKLRQRFSVCLVSPELQGTPAGDIDRFADLYGVADAVCTKYPECWAPTDS